MSDYLTLAISFALLGYGIGVIVGVWCMRQSRDKQGRFTK